MKDGIAKIQAHKRRYAVRKSKHRRESSFGSTTFTDGESDSEDETEFCGSGEWAAQGVSGVGWGGIRPGGGPVSTIVCSRTVVLFLFLPWCSCSIFRLLL